MGMRVKKAVAAAVMIVALVAIFVGISYVNDYTSQVTRRNVVSTESIVISPDGYGQLSLEPNASEQEYYCAIDITNGTLRESAVTEEMYTAWLNGSCTLAWHEIPTLVSPQSSSEYHEEWPLNAINQKMHYIFWNPNAPVSKGVTMTIYQQWNETIYNNCNLGIGVFLIIVGAIAGLVAAFAVSKRVLMVVVALVLIFSGAALAINYSHTFHHEGIIAADTLLVPADSYVNQPIRYNATGNYAIFLKTENATLNATVLSEDEFNAFSQGQYQPNWHITQGWTYGFSGKPLDAPSANQVRLVLYNPDTSEKQVITQVYGAWDEYNLVGLVSGILLIALGTDLFCFANIRQIAEFNVALEKESQQKDP
jgi:hypothetical protein